MGSRCFATFACNSSRFDRVMYACTWKFTWVNVQPFVDIVMHSKIISYCVMLHWWAIMMLNLPKSPFLFIFSVNNNNTHELCMYAYSRASGEGEKGQLNTYIL